MKIYSVVLIVECYKITLDFSLYTFYTQELLPRQLKLPTLRQEGQAVEDWKELVYFEFELLEKMKAEK